MTAADPMGIGRTDAQSPCESRFVSSLKVRAFDAGPIRVLELGTRRWEPDRATHHRVWMDDVPAAAVEWVMTDMTTGVDVDVVADAHDMTSVFGLNGFDGYVAVSVYEHLRRPWIAAEQAAHILKPGGWLYVATHQTFPLHGYPHDYFRFSREALAGIFEDAGFMVHDSSYSFPCVIEPPAEVTRWNRAPDVQAWLNVDVVAQLA